LAATDAFELVENHPFLDGNKRTAAVVSESFLNLHNAELGPPTPKSWQQLKEVAAGRISEEELISFFEAHTQGDC
jgi:death on curing protein